MKKSLLIVFASLTVLFACSGAQTPLLPVAPNPLLHPMVSYSPASGCEGEHETVVLPGASGGAAQRFTHAANGTLVSGAIIEVSGSQRYRRRHRNWRRRRIERWIKTVGLRSAVGNCSEVRADVSLITGECDICGSLARWLYDLPKIGFQNRLAVDRRNFVENTVGSALVPERI